MVKLERIKGWVWSETEAAFAWESWDQGDDEPVYRKLGGV